MGNGRNVQGENDLLPVFKSFPVGIERLLIKLKGNQDGLGLEASSKESFSFKVTSTANIFRQ